MKHGLCMIIAILILFAACVQVAPPTPTGGTPPPSIVVFDVKPPTVAGGSTATLSWDVAGANNVAIDQGIGSVALKGSRDISPASSTTYTITATGPGGTSTATAQVVVAGSSPSSFNLPSVPVFYTQPPNIVTGMPSVLRWEVANASDVFIEPQIGTVPVSGSKNVNPMFTTNYKLTANNGQGSIVATTTLTVSSLPVNRDSAAITSFKANTYVIRKGESAILSWSTINGSSVTLEPGLGTVAADGSRQVSPAETTTYTLLVTSTDSAQYQTATVNVR